MRDCMRKRILQEAEYVIKTGSTVRKTAQKFGVSKSTVYTDLAKRLKSISLRKYLQVRIIMERNKSERSLRGGLATKKKYQKEK